MTVYIVDIEAVETRYTAQWKTYVPQLLRDNGLDVVVIEGPTDIPAATTPGAFLNFGGTNVYKASQVEQIGRMFCNGVVKDGDYFLFTDAWHPGIINLKYMAELLKVKIKIGGCWHAGSYDPWDFLGRLIGDAPWVRHAEKSFFYCIDHNYFATDFHINMFLENEMGIEPRTGRMNYIPTGKIVRTGWPMAYMPDTLAKYTDLPKKDLILFPHRIAPEKQVEIFRDLEKELPQYKFIVCQDTRLTKHEYHVLLGSAKMVFSCSLQETLGIGTGIEGPTVGAIPFVPDSLSYSEMFNSEFKYPVEWTQNYASYQKHKIQLVNSITSLMDNYSDMIPQIKAQQHSLLTDFFSAGKMVETIKCA